MIKNWTFPRIQSYFSLKNIYGVTSGMKIQNLAPLSADNKLCPLLKLKT